MSIEERIDRLESLDEIRQLAAKYSLTLDMRDIDMHVNLFVPDVRVGKEESGRQALKKWADATYIIFFNQNDRGHHINVSAGAISKHSKNSKESLKFLEWSLRKRALEDRDEHHFYYVISQIIASNGDFQKIYYSIHNHNLQLAIISCNIIIFSD